MVVRVSRQAGAAALAKCQCPVKFSRTQTAVRPGTADFVQQRGWREPAAQCQRHHVLHQYIERLVGHRAFFDAASFGGVAGGCGFQQLQRVRRHQRDAAGPTWRMAAAARALQQPGHALGRTNLQHPLNRQKINTQV